MGRLGPNQALAVEVIARLRAAGVRTFCLCPGGRNAPLVEALDAAAADALDVLDFFDERSAAFFALGRARRDAVPVAVVTTSGTASAELLPAMIEAYYSCTPLVAVTADRPRSYRGTGAPQSIEQRGLFGVYACQQLDLERPGEAWRLDPVAGPSHVNVCFDEPLLDGWQPSVPAAAPFDAAPAAVLSGLESAPSAREELSAALHGCSRPLVLLGALARPDDREEARAWCGRLLAPILAEASSGLRGRLRGLLLTGGEAAARRGLEQHVFDSVILLGDIPCFRLWRDLEATWRLPVVSISRTPWPGLTHGVHVGLAGGRRLSDVLPDLPPFPADRCAALLDFDRGVAALADCLLSDYPDSEPALIRRVARAIPDEAFVYLGNSQPIREWTQFAPIDSRDFVFGGNRGANGIDGQLSTFLGQADGGRENWAIVGDLTALYDLQAPWALRHAAGPVRLVVINNGGGRIFDRMFVNPRFQNRHALGFEPVAALWGLGYRTTLPAPGEDPAALIELRPDDGQTAAFWKALREGTMR